MCYGSFDLLGTGKAIQSDWLSRAVVGWRRADLWGKGEAFHP